MRLENLTGHPIHLWNGSLDEYVYTLEESENFSPLRCGTHRSTIGEYNGVEIIKMEYHLNVPLSLLKKIKESCDGIVVSRIVAEQLAEFGYNGDIYMIGNKKRNEDGRVVGSYGLSKFN